MYKTQKTKSETDTSVAQSNQEQSVQFKDNRSTTFSISDQIQDSPKQVTQRVIINNYSNAPVQRQENKTGLPDNLKSGIENLSGHSMDDVRVHYNSAQPAQLQAHAYAQGNQIHVASGQEKHLPHEAWHVVQQKQGRVQPTKQLKGKVNINDNSGLETEADIMGVKAMQFTGKTNQKLQHISNSSNSSQLKSVQLQSKVIQRHVGMEMELDVPVFKPIVPASVNPEYDKYKISPKSFGFLQSTNNYSRNDISGNADQQGYRIQVDHNEFGKKLDGINRSFKRFNELPNHPGEIGCLEYVIGGPQGTDEESAEGYEQMVVNAGKVADAAKKLVEDVKEEKIISIGNYRVGIPIDDLYQYMQQNGGVGQTAIDDYDKILDNIEPVFNIQVTAGVNPRNMLKFMKKANNNELISTAASTGYDNNSMKLSKKFVEKREKGFGLRDFLNTKGYGTNNLTNYRKMITSYLSLCSQDVLFNLLIADDVGNWKEYKKSTKKNGLLLLPQSDTSKIILSSAPPQLQDFFRTQKQPLKQIFFDKLKSIFTGGFQNINKEVTANAIKSRLQVNDNELPNSDLESKVAAKIDSTIRTTLNKFFSEIEGGDRVQSYSNQHFTFHPVDSQDQTKGNKIPIEFRHIKNGSKVKADDLVEKAKLVMNKVKSYND